MSSSIPTVSKCIICFTRLQSELCNKDPENFTIMFNLFCHLLEINLIEGMTWNFEQDYIPFCEFCASAVEKLQGLHDELKLLQHKINNILRVTRENIFNSGGITMISDELAEIDRVIYFRQEALRGYQPVKYPDNIEEEVSSTLQTNTDVLFKLEMTEVENNGNISSFLDRINEDCGIKDEIDIDDPLDGVNNETAYIRDNDVSSEDVKCDVDLFFIEPEDTEESVESSRITADIINADSDGINKCRYCERTFRRKCSLKLHLKRHLEAEQYECGNCEEIFETKKSLELHRRESHFKKEGIYKYNCDVCQKVFNFATDLQLHTAMHNRITPYKCEVCGKYFSQSYNLKQHKVIHSGEKPFNCDVCGKDFKYSFHLASHIRTHTGEKPYKCEVCDLRFSQSNILHRHRKIHTGEKPYKCETCEKCFLQKCHLIRHTRLHSGEKPFQCDICNKCFTRREKLVIHERKHS